MSLPETIWWCKGHSDASRVPYHPAIEGDWRDDNCKWEEFELRPVGTRVAGPDDLVIRREDYDAAVERAYRMFRSWLVEDNDAPLRSAVKAALAAAEGGEG